MMSLKAQRSCPPLNFITAFSAVVGFNREGHYHQAGNYGKQGLLKRMCGNN